MMVSDNQKFSTDVLIGLILMIAKRDLMTLRETKAALVKWIDY